MKERIRLSLKYINKFGFINGINLSYKLFYKGSEIKLSRGEHPFSIRKQTSDLEVFNQIFLYDQYSISLGFEPKVIIDGGGNIGLSSIYFSKIFPKARILSIEPDRENFELLSRNTISLKNITAINGALWHKKTFLYLNNSNESFWARRVGEAVENDTVPVVTYTIPELLQSYKFEVIDLLKLDIESSEKFLFEQDYEMWMNKIRVIVIELHDDILPGCSQAFFSAINKVYKRYRIYTSGENIIVFNDDIS